MHLTLGCAVLSLSTVAAAADLEEVRKAGRLRVVVAVKYFGTQALTVLGRAP